MTDQERLNQIEERLAKATPGPWVIDEDPQFDMNTEVFKHYEYAIKKEEKFILWDLGSDQNKANADFIANAPGDIQWLLDKVKELQSKRPFKELDLASEVIEALESLPQAPDDNYEHQPCKCCERANQYNGYNSDGPFFFICPKHCSCHD